MPENFETNLIIEKYWFLKIGFIFDSFKLKRSETRAVNVNLTTKYFGNVHTKFQNNLKNRKNPRKKSSILKS